MNDLRVALTDARGGTILTDCEPHRFRLLGTCDAFVPGSEVGYFTKKLDSVLHFETKAAQLNLSGPNPQSGGRTENVKKRPKR